MPTSSIRKRIRPTGMPRAARGAASQPHRSTDEICRLLSRGALHRLLDSLHPRQFFLGAVAESRSKKASLIEGCREAYRQIHQSVEGWTILSGRYRIEIEGKFSMMRRGDCLILPPGTMHSHHVHPSDNYVAIGWSVFPLNIMIYVTHKGRGAARGRGYGHHLLPRAELPEVEVVERMAARARYWTRDRLAHHAGRCISLLFRAASAILSHRRPWLGNRNARRERKIEAIKEFIRQRYYQDLTLALIARSVGYSPAYCCNVFSRSEKMSPMAYLSKVRFDAATRLLGETDLLVKEIAGRVGFQSANYFVRRFRHVFGMTPLAYRVSAPSGE